MSDNLIFTDFFMATPDLVWIAGKNGYLKKVNPAVCKKMGYSQDELLSKPITEFIHPEDVEKTMLSRLRLFEGEVLHNFCNRYITSDGKILWLEWTSVYNAKSETVLGIAKDITDRKRIEEEVEEQYIKFKGLADHFKNRMEDDRKYFAVELHEELAQLLAVINLDVSWISTQAEVLPDTIISRLQHASAACKLMIKTIQRLSFSISPQMMDDVGLNAAMEWLCREFTILNGIECSFEHCYLEHDLTREIKLDFFRTCQEVFADILNSGDSGKITVSIQDVGTEIVLAVFDSGDGLATSPQDDILTGIRQRAKSINGKITVWNRPGKGSSISLSVNKQQEPAYN